MTDLEKLEKTFNELGVEFEKVLEKESIYLKLSSGIGHMGFICEFYFLNGKFINHGLWE